MNGVKNMRERKGGREKERVGKREEGEGGDGGKKSGRGGRGREGGGGSHKCFLMKYHYTHTPACYH